MKFKGNNTQPTEVKMPIIKVWCLPKNITEDRLQILCKSIITTVESIHELDLFGKDAITVLFPSDRMEWGLGDEIIAEVAIFNKPERTDVVCAKLAEKVGTLLHGNFPSAKIECFIHPLERSSGFWKIHPHPKTKQPSSTTEDKSGEPRNISGYLDRMRSDAASIHERLMQAPADLTGTNEPALYKILNQIKNLLDEAEEVWPGQSQPTEAKNG